MFQSNDNLEKDNELADFTDRVLGGGVDKTASAADGDLPSLEKTILRLSDAFPQKILDDAAAKQMLVRLKARSRRQEEERATRPSFWRRFFDFQSNPQVGLIFAVAVALALIIVSLPSLQPTGSSVSGTANGGANPFITAGLIGVLLVIYWISRRRSK